MNHEWKIVKYYSQEAEEFLKEWENNQMIKNYICIDGKRIKISDETAEEFKKQFNPSFMERVQGYLDTHPFGHDEKVTIIDYHGKKLIKVPLPSCNAKWTFESFDYVRNLCEKFDVGFAKNKLCPVHGSYAPADNKALYVRIGQ